MLTSPRSSSGSPPTIFIGNEPSARCIVGTQSSACSAASTSPPTSSAIARLDVVPDVGVLADASTGSRRTAPASRAIEAAVSATCAGGEDALDVRAAGEAVDARRPSVFGLAEVEHHALADQRVEDLAGVLERLGLLHDLPDQEPVVRLGERVVVVVDADRALDPPVRRVQAVGVVLALEDHRVAGRAVVEPAGLGDLVDQLVVGVDPDVPALGVVVVVGELPVDDLGQPARHRDRPACRRGAAPGPAP